MSRPRGNQRGFTLLELLITLSVTTIGLIGLLSLHLSVARGNDGASRSAEAQALCVSELETLRSMQFVDLMSATTGSDPTSFPRTRSPALPPQGRGGQTYNMLSTITNLTSLSPNLLKIRVVVTWAEEGATFGSGSGAFDHSLALEVVRTVQEAL